MDTLLSAAHLKREIGGELFAALVSSDNTAVVREFAQKLVGVSFPTTMTIGDRTYDILSFHEGDQVVKGDVMVKRAKKMDAHQGQDEGEHLLANQDDIPEAFRDKIVFVFTNWRRPDDPVSVAYLRWSGDRWIQYWSWLGGGWDGGCRVLRRHSTRA